MVENKSSDRIEKLDSILSPEIRTNYLKTSIDKTDMNNEDIADCKIESYFSNIELPLIIDYDFLISFDRRNIKTQIPYNCLGDGTVEKYQGLPVSINYAYGKINIKDTIDYYLIITGSNPDNPLDMAFISASILTKLHDKLDNEIQIAKYHYYSMIKEEYYCTIHENGLVEQTYKHTGEYEGKKDIFEQGDTTFTLLNYWNKNLR